MPEDNNCILRFAKLSEHAFAPTRGSSKAAGYDLKRLEFNFICFLLFY